MMKVCLFLLVALTGSLSAQELTPLDRVLERFGDAITFHAGWEANQPAADMASGQAQPLAVDDAVLSDGCLIDGVITYDGGANINIGSSGTLLIWIAVDRGEATSQDEGYTFPLRLFGSDAQVPSTMLMLGKANKANACKIYAHVEAANQKSAHISGPSTLDWQADDWHLVVLVWRPGTFELALDGRVLGRRAAPQLATISTRLLLSAGGPVRLRDCLVLDRPLLEGEIAWIHQTMGDDVTRNSGP